MPAYIEELAARVSAVLGDRVRRYGSMPDEVAIEVASEHLLEVAGILRDEPQLRGGSRSGLRHHGSAPSSFENVPVGPSGPSSASRTGSRAPSSTVRVPMKLLSAVLV